MLFRYHRVAWAITFAIVAIPCAAQDAAKEAAISSLIGYTRSNFAGPDGATLKTLFEPLKEKNPSTSEADWRAFLIEVSSYLEPEVLKPGSAPETGLRRRLQTLSTDEIRSVEEFLRSPAYTKYRDAVGHRDVGDGTMDALFLALQNAGPKISAAAALHGLKDR